MNNWCICWFFTHILLGILIFKGLTARRHYMSFGVKGLILNKLKKSTSVWSRYTDVDDVSSLSLLSKFKQNRLLTDF
jgi:hypothetical protein